MGLWMQGLSVLRSEGCRSGEWEAAFGSTEEFVGGLKDSLKAKEVAKHAGESAGCLGRLAERLGMQTSCLCRGWCVCGEEGDQDFSTSHENSGKT